MERRDFLQMTGLAAGALLVPPHARPWSGSLTPIPGTDRKQLADAALETARSRGASYADVRISRYLNQFINGRETKIQNVVSTESFGVGIRVIADGTWGFAATQDVTLEGVRRAAIQAVAIAKANSRLQTEPVRLAPQRGHGEVSWKTPIRKNAFEVSIQEKADLLTAVGDAALKAGASYIFTGLFLVTEQKSFASTDRSSSDQDVPRTWPNVQVTLVDQATGKFETRDALSSPVGMGWEYLAGRPADTVKTPGGALVYGDSYDMLEDARLAATQAKEKQGAKSVEAGKWDLVLDPSHTWLTIHESVGHPLELDRVLGYEANYAGTSFATLDKWKSKSFKYGSPLVNFVADKVQPGSRRCRPSRSRGPSRWRPGSGTWCSTPPTPG